MSAYRDNLTFAEAGYTDLRDFTPPPPPVCAKQAEWEDRTRAEDAAERDERIARDVAAERADIRARATINHATRVQELAASLGYALAAARQDRFTTPHADEIAELMARTVNSLREQKEQA